MSLARRLIKILTLPVRRILDPRFHDVTHRISLGRQEVAALDRRIDDALRNVVDRTAETTAAQVETLAVIGRELRGAAAEVAAVEQTVAALDARVTHLVERSADDAYRRRMADMTGGDVDGLDQQAADLVNYASGHRGFAAQRGLWLNPPVVLEHIAGDVRLSTVNERILEIPFALQALASIARGGRVLDFGGCESHLALSVASLGYPTTLVDLSPYRLAHPNLTTVQSALEDWDAPPASFDAALVVSTVEHVGLGWYGESPGRYDDRSAMARIRELVVPGGLVVLTVPYGTRSVTDVQRVYDRAALDDLLDGLVVEERLIAEETDGRWTLVEDTTAHGVAMVTARTPAG